MTATTTPLRTPLTLGTRGLLCSLALSLAACGNGGRDPKGEDDRQLRMGVLAPLTISGVTYETETTSGVTDEDGIFKYAPGETVRFSLGDTLLGEVKGQAEVTPFDLAGTDAPIGNTAVRLATNESADAFHKVINLAVLFQTLDADQNSENGVEITQEVATAFEGLELRLSKRWNRFPSDNRFRVLMGRVRAMLGSRPVVRSEYAVEELYALLGIDAELHQLTRTRTLTGHRRAQYWQYDLRGNATRVSADEGYDDTFDRVQTYSYNANGRVSYSSVLDGQNERQRADYFLYDDNGNVTLREIDVHGDRTLVSVTTSEYDSRGYLVGQSFDSNNDGAIDAESRYEFDERGNQIGYHFGDPGEAPRQSERYEHDENDNLVLFEILGGPARVVYYFDEYEYDEHNRPTHQGSDIDGDGLVDETVSYEYDARGRWTRFEKDGDADGTPDYIETADYDSWGNTTRLVSDFGADGTPDEIRTWEYNEDGNAVRFNVDHDADGNADDVQTNLYSDYGLLIDQRTDFRNAVITDSRQLLEYEPTQGWVSVLGE